MQHVQITAGNDYPTFYCPVTGVQIFGEHGQNGSPAMLGWWDASCGDTPGDIRAKLKKYWTRWEKKNPDEDLDKFFASVTAPETENWVCFEIRSAHTTDHIVIDLGLKTDEE